MKTMIKYISSAMLFLSLSTVSVYAQQIKIDVQKGNKFIVETTTSTVSVAQVMGQVMENNSDSKRTTIYEVLATKLNEYDLQSTLIKMKIDVSMMGQNMNFDSDKKENKGPLANELTDLINKVRSISINNNGEITKQDKNERSSLSMLLPNGSEVQIVTEMFIPALLNKELKAGYSFADSSNLIIEKLSFKDSGTYTITGINNGIANITYKGNQLTTGVMEQMGMEMKTSSINTVTKELWVDIKTGIVLMQTSTIDAVTNIEAGGMVIPTTIKTITTINITRSLN